MIPLQRLLENIYRKFTSVPAKTTKQKIEVYLKNGKVPWSEGYVEYKWESISKSINAADIIDGFRKNNVPDNYGIGLDERIVEYPWIISNLSNGSSVFLDAGSTFNFKILLEHPVVSAKNISIYTYSPEGENFNEKKISYIYGDLRSIPFKNELFDEIVCQSTIEHIGMNNRIYGYDLDIVSDHKENNEYLIALNELLRVLKTGGKLLLTFPFGKFENHGFFQQFDNKMLGKIEQVLIQNGKYELSFFRYFKIGWKYVKQEDAEDAESYNPHTGVGKMNDGAAHCRAVCCIRFIKQ
jgi:SAM-dependent methyltransferase